MNFFSKSSKKHKKAQPSTSSTTSTTPVPEINESDFDYDNTNRFENTSPSPSSSPPKKSFPSRAAKIVSGSGSVDEKRQRPQPQPNSRSSSSFSRRDKDSSRSASSRHTFDATSHPLNLPPDQLRRLSALSNMSESSQMDVDEPTPSSPVQQTQSVPGSFDAPPASTPNGVNGTENDTAPVPPPHKSAPTSPEAAAVPEVTPEEAEAFKAAGNKFYKAADYKKAIIEYTKAVDAQPTSATYLSNRAAAFMANGQYPPALEDCIQADALDPENPKVLMRMSRIYTSMGRPEEAIRTFEKIDPPAAAKDILPAKLMLQHIQGADDALKNGTTGSMALHALDQAEKLMGLGASKPRKWQLMRGEAYLKMGNVNALGDAQNVAMNLLRNNRQDPDALVLRGRALYAQGENEKAIQHFRQALSCDPDFKDAVKYLRLVQKLDRMKEDGNKDYKAGRWQSAVDKYTSALEVDPLNKGTNSKLYQNRALCFTKLKKYSDAIADCEKALQLDPSYTKARKTKAAALGASGDWQASVNELKSIQELDPSDAAIAKEIRKAELELKKSKRKDYYKILGLDKDANDNDIKKAYRKLAIIHHPDKNRDDESAAERFKDVGEAYECLSDDQKRAAYDRGDELMDANDMFGGGGHGGMGGMGGMDQEMLFNLFGSQMGGGGMGGGRGGPSPFGGRQGGQQFHFG